MHTCTTDINDCLSHICGTSMTTYHTFVGQLAEGVLSAAHWWCQCIWPSVIRLLVIESSRWLTSWAVMLCLLKPPLPHCLPLLELVPVAAFSSLLHEVMFLLPTHTQVTALSKLRCVCLHSACAGKVFQAVHMYNVTVTVLVNKTRTASLHSTGMQTMHCNTNMHMSLNYEIDSRSQSKVCRSLLVFSITSCT